VSRTSPEKQAGASVKAGSRKLIHCKPQEKVTGSQDGNKGDLVRIAEDMYAHSIPRTKTKAKKEGADQTGERNTVCFLLGRWEEQKVVGGGT